MFEYLRIVQIAFRKGLMLVAGTIVLLHVLVPHWHESELNAQAHDPLHSQNHSMVDFLQLILHEADHMDEEVIPIASLPQLPAFVAVLAAIFHAHFGAIQSPTLSIAAGHVAPLARGCLSAAGCRPPPFLG